MLASPKQLHKLLIVSDDNELKITLLAPRSDDTVYSNMS